MPQEDEKTKVRLMRDGVIKENRRIIDELIREDVDLDVIQRVTGAYESFIIGRKIEFLQNQLEIAYEHEGKISK